MPHEAIPGLYATYEYYTESYKGESLGPGDFTRYAKWATALVDQMTFGRIMDLPEVPDCVRDAVCNAAEQKYSYQSKSDQEFKSESNDGYSVSYADAGEKSDFLKNVMADIRTYLSGTGLLFRGTRKPGRGWCGYDH